jgi:hypothetical protein
VTICATTESGGVGMPGISCTATAAAASIHTGAGTPSRADSRLTNTAPRATALVNARTKAYRAVSDNCCSSANRRAEAIADQPSRHTDAHTTPVPSLKSDKSAVEVAVVED